MGKMFKPVLVYHFSKKVEYDFVADISALKLKKYKTPKSHACGKVTRQSYGSLIPS
jgi:hypothetical protein